MRSTFTLTFIGVLLTLFAFTTTAYSQCFSCGTGVDGAYHATTNTTLAGGVYNYTSFIIDAGVTVTVTGTDSLVIYSTGAVNIEGSLLAEGGAGQDGVTFSTFGIGGVGVAGGYKGGDGIFTGSANQGSPGQGPGAGGGGNGWSGGGGGGHAMVGDTAGSAGGNGGIAYGTPQLSPLQGGSGGGGGSGGNNCGSGGGGAGGGILVISTCDSLIVSSVGLVSVDGGDGGSDGTGNCGGGGGGAGGSLWLSANHIEMAGTLSSVGGIGGTSSAGASFNSTGGTGSDGRIRMDYASISNTGSVTPVAGFTGTTLAISVTGNDIVCFGASTGDATATPLGGVSPFMYSWSSGGMLATESGLAAGTYSVTITDSIGCTATDSVTLVDLNTQVMATATWTDVSCHGGIDGTAMVVASGGVPGYTYLWSPGGSTTDTVSGLGGGAYLVTVTDSVGCTTTDTAFITEPQSALSTTTTGTDETCAGCSDGTATTTPAGGTAPYTYLWSNGDTTANATGLAAGSHTVTVTDTNGCTVTDSVEIGTMISVLGNLESALEIYPNPAHGQLHVELAGVVIENGTMEMYSAIGTQVYQQAMGTEQAFTLPLTGMAEGMYWLRINSDAGQVVRKIWVD